MLLKSLITTGIESMLNTLLHRFPSLKVACQRLSGKVLLINLKELSVPIVLFFSEYQINILGEWKGKIDCSITIYMSVLPKLCEHQQLTTLIHSGKLKIEGNLQVVKNFVALADDLNKLDLADLLAPYIGDIAVESISKVFRDGLEFLRKGMQRHRRYIADVVIEEWHIAPGLLEALWFAEETAAIDHATEAFVKRLKKLEFK